MKYLVIVVLLIGCCPTRDIVRQDTIYIQPPAIEGGNVVIPDSLLNWYYTELFNQDTIVRIQYVDKEKKVYYKVVPKPITIIQLDTVKQCITETVNKPTFWQKIQFGSVGVVIGILLIGGLFLVRKIGWI